jgi:COMPASS component BRE2
VADPVDWQKGMHRRAVMVQVGTNLGLGSISGRTLEARAAITMLPSADTPEPSPLPTPTASRKRKHTALTPNRTTFSSPAPDTHTAHTATTPSPIVDLSTRPRLTISRGPTFTPISDESPYHTTEQLAMNRIGFRYIPAGVSPPGSVLPCTTIQSAPTSFRVSWEDRSPFISVTTDGLCLAGNKGFRSARCNAPVREGKWYMEVKIDLGGGDRLPDETKSSAREGSYVRLGFGRREASLNGPVGLDGYSYGIRDKTGEKVTLSRPRPYGRPFKSGDVVGMYISLPPRVPPTADPYDPAHIKRERIAIELKGQEYFESLEYPQSKEMISLMDYSSKSADASASIPSSSSNKKSATVKNLSERGGPGSRASKAPSAPAPLRPLPTLPNSMIAFFINGESQGIAFRDLYSFLQLRTAPASRKGARRNNRSGAGEYNVKHKENPFDDGTLGYFPFISLFNDARVCMNPGPDFDYPPPEDIDALLLGTEPQTRTWRPMIERYPEFMAEQWQLDADEEAAAKVAAAAKAAEIKAEAAKEAQREKRRAQAVARKRAKQTATDLAMANVGMDAAITPGMSTPRMDMEVSPAPPMRQSSRQASATPAMGSPLPWPSLMRPSPAPTVESSVDLPLPEPPNEYTSEYGDVDIDGPGDVDEGEAIKSPGEDPMLSLSSNLDFLASISYQESLRMQMPGRTDRCTTSVHIPKDTEDN